RKGLIGPWNHAYPHEGRPGPAIDYLSESLRWWDHWLKGRATGIMDEPMLRAWMQDIAVIAGMADSPGRWVAEKRWPSPHIATTTLYLNAGSLDATSKTERTLSLTPNQTVGAAGGRWLALNPALDLPLEQSVDDAHSLCFDSSALTEELEIFGRAALELDVAVDQPVAFLAARLNDVETGGESRRVSYAVLNLCHRNSDERPSLLVPGARYRARLELDSVAHRFSAGHRLRIALSTAYWPLILPSPHPVTLTVFTGHSCLALPVRPREGGDERLPVFGAPQFPAMAVDGGPLEEPERRLTWNQLNNTQTIERRGGGVVMLHETATEVRRSIASTTTIAADTPMGASAEYRIEFSLGRGEWQPKVATTTRMELTVDDFVLHARVLATLGTNAIGERNFTRRIRRRLV
ncbi:MAG: CocE/NonD family hydrolase, partial [Steroidobacteraceae bacterium]